MDLKKGSRKVYAEKRRGGRRRACKMNEQKKCIKLYTHHEDRSSYRRTQSSLENECETK